MSETTLQLILGIVLPVVVTTLGFITRDWWRKRKNTISYGDNLIDAMNKTTETLKKARTEIAEIQEMMRTQDEQHSQEIEDLQHQHRRERDRLKKRLDELEKVLVRYDVSFTLVTKPDVKVENLKVVGMEDAMSTSQKMKAITQEQVDEIKKRAEQIDKDRNR